jgi:uncharacterized damage-inducible protein DinB
VTDHGPTTELPTDEFETADERTMLLAFLDYQRRVLARKAEGLTDEQVRIAACPPSDMTLLGLIRHMADVERAWFERGVLDSEVGPIFFGAAHPDGDDDGDFHPPSDATIAEAFAAYWREIELANEITAAEASLDTVERRSRPPRPQYSLRWILVHMIEEYARHCGHADLLRQAIDGSVGD